MVKLNQSGLTFVLRLTLDWLFALFVVFRKEPPSPRKELLIRISAWVIALSLLAGTMALQVLVSSQLQGNSFDATSWDRVIAANHGASLALRLVSLAMAAFIVFCAVCSLVVLNRSESRSKSSVQGFFFVILFFCFVSPRS